MKICNFATAFTITTFVFTVLVIFTSFAMAKSLTAMSGMDAATGQGSVSVTSINSVILPPRLRSETQRSTPGQPSLPEALNGDGQSFKRGDAENEERIFKGEDHEAETGLNERVSI